ncbi:SUKH-4 family immunity protein [Nonomuraea longicatena]|uniref:SUKH-4 immunity protein of toxin-antitoxin system n=1 Tax=Nonomuraea longicatena TaxID=83682 RepID=A0ABP3ZWZ2_9ACTN
MFLDAHAHRHVGRLAQDLIHPVLEDPRACVLVEVRDPAELGLDIPHYVLDLDDPRCTDRDAFDAWYGEQSGGLPGPFTADQVYPNLGMAAVAARARGADPGTGPLAERVARAWTDGLTPAARAAASVLSLAVAPVGRAAWWLLHTRRTVDQDGFETASRGVDEAAAALPTAGPGLPAYAIPLPELAERLAPPAAERPGAHRDLAAVARSWQEITGFDEIAWDYLPLEEHLYLAGVEEVAPAAPYRPPVRVTRALLEETFGADGLVRLRPEQVHPRITHAPTRDFLTDVGLPAKGLHTPWAGLRCVAPVAEQWEQEDLRRLRACPELPEPDSVFMIDTMDDDWRLLLDGATGIVHEFRLRRGQVHRAHRSIESYAYCVHAVCRWANPGTHDDAECWVALNLMIELYAYEPLLVGSEDDRCWPLELGALYNGYTDLGAF